MSVFGNPAPQWTQLRSVASVATRLAPVLDASGFWTLQEAAIPSGAFVDDPTGFTTTDNTTTSGLLKTTLLPSGFVTTY